MLDALRLSNVEAAPGKIGENSDKGTSRCSTRSSTPASTDSQAEYENIPIRATADGEISASKTSPTSSSDEYFDVETSSTAGRRPRSCCKQLPGTNASEVIAAVKERLAALKQSIPRRA